MKPRTMVGGPPTTYCAFCNHETRINDPDALEQIQAHIRECPLHPLRAAEQTIGELRDSLGKVEQKYALKIQDYHDTSCASEVLGGDFCHCTDEEVAVLNAYYS